MHCGDFSLAYRFGRNGMNRGLVRDRISGTARRSGSGGASRRWGVRCAEALFGSRGRRRLNFLRVKGVWPMELAGIAVDRLAVLKLAETPDPRRSCGAPRCFSPPAPATNESHSALETLSTGDREALLDVRGRLRFATPAPAGNRRPRGRGALDEALLA